MEYIRFTNWEKYQHYKKRRPPWIRMHNSLLRSQSFMGLPEAARWHAVGLMLVASQHCNVIPWDVSWLRLELRAKAPIDFARLFASGLIEPCNSEGVPEVQRYRGTDNSDSSEVQTPPAPPGGTLPGKRGNHLVSPDHFLKLWNAAAGRQGWQAIRSMSSGRQKCLRARCGDQDWRSTWEEALAKAEESEFLRGKNDRGWRANADWFLRPDTVVKIMEGMYGNRGGGRGSDFDKTDYTVPEDLK